MDNNRTLTLAEVETALCVWEDLLERRDSELFRSLFDNHGTSCMRSCAIQAGLIAEETFTLLEKQGYEFSLPFDWEFVPFIVSQLDWRALMTDNQYGGAAYQPDIAELAGKALESFKNDFQWSDPQQTWVNNAASWARQLYAYPGLITENEEDAIVAYKAGETPKEYVQRLGEKFNLTRR